MTAIYGLWRFVGGTSDSDLQRMDRALERYGSDGQETWSRPSGPGLGRRLHRTLPEDSFSALINIGPRYVVAGDVRLTEREDLVRQLDLGREAARMSDAAIAALAIETWNEEAFDRIYGAFAIAAWDTRDQRLLLARDHLGHKPLFFHSAGDFFAFASMPAGLHALPEVPRGPDIESIKRFLALENASPGRSHYEAISRVMPGHYMIVSPSGWKETRYWNPDLSPLRLPRSEDYADALAKHLEDAVTAALRGVETQVGAHLSSGFDSTAVATTAALQLAARGAKVVAYTSAPREGIDRTFPDRAADESIMAKATAAMHPNMEHVVIRSDRTPLDNLRRTSSIYGVPVFNICNTSWYDAFNDDAAARGIRIMLEAPMGNATISETGTLALPELVRSGRLVAWTRLALALVRKGVMSWPAVAWHSFSNWLPNGLYGWLTERRYGALVSPSRFSPLKEKYLNAAVREAAKESAVPGAEDRLLSSGRVRPTGSSLADRLISIAAEDGGAMSKGRLGEWKIDYRDPTADRRLVEFSLRVPAAQLIHGGEPRALLRKVLADRAPADVLNNRARGYQLADWHEWLDKAREDVIDEVERIERFEPSAEILDVDRLKGLLDNWPESGSEEWTGYAAAIDYRCCLLRAISASSFMRHASGSNI